VKDPVDFESDLSALSTYPATLKARVKWSQSVADAVACDQCELVSLPDLLERPETVPPASSDTLD